MRSRRREWTSRTLTSFPEMLGDRREANPSNSPERPLRLSPRAWLR
jgi:hypothetical protein